jgi:hypothetical protein
MNLPSASPNENMKIASSISPMPASRAERSSSPVEIFESSVMAPGRFPLVLCDGPFRPAASCAHCCFKDVGARDKPGHDD